jgi:hypothetical protein
MAPREKPKYPESGDVAGGAPDDASPTGRRADGDSTERGKDSGSVETAPRSPPSGGELESYERPADRDSVETIRKSNS